MLKSSTRLRVNRGEKGLSSVVKEMLKNKLWCWIARTSAADGGGLRRTSAANGGERHFESTGRKG